MCGIAGLIHRGKSSNVGRELTAMLQSLKHRGPDSTGFALYGSPKLGEHVDLKPYAQLVPLDVLAEVFKNNARLTHLD